MRKILPIAVLTGIILVLASCTESLPRRFEAFVSSVEEDCSFLSYEEGYWMEKDRRFKILYDEYMSKRSSFSSEEKRDLNAAIARYEYRRINSFVSYVEENASELSEDDWLGLNERFLEMAREYKENRHAYNSTEKRRIDSAILHYCGIVIRSKIPGITDKIRSILRELSLAL